MSILDKMTKKKIAPVRKYEPAKFKVEETLLTSQPQSMPSNLEEEKVKFLRSGKAPDFCMKDKAKMTELASKTRNQIRFELLGEAQYILNKVYDMYGNGEYFLEHAFGTRIMKDEATPMLLKYIDENSLTESIKIHWCDNMACSAKLAWTGPVVNANRPDLRRYSLWINGSEENNYMRESGICCLLDHEIGTHFFRSFNDGFQPWFSDRERFGLRKLGTFEVLCTEEGLAAIHTVLRGRVKFLWGAALAYYTACKASEMTFKELFDHLGQYTSNKEYRWKQAMRVKRGLPNPNSHGGFGKDQCYFEGAVAILRNMENIDFYLLMTGKVCHDELDRIKRVARRDVLHYPAFMKNMSAYQKTLRKIISLNCLDGLHPHKNPSAVDRKPGKKSQRQKKVRANSKLNFIAKKMANNKKRLSQEKQNRDVDRGEIESFKCSYPFVNFHQMKKQLEDNNIFIASEATLNDVTKLSSDILTKDSNLNDQIHRLQGIIQDHTWACEDNDYKNSLMKEAVKQFSSSESYQDSRSQSQLSTTPSFDGDAYCTSQDSSMEFGTETPCYFKGKNGNNISAEQDCDRSATQHGNEISSSNSVSSFSKNDEFDKETCPTNSFQGISIDKINFAPIDEINSAPIDKINSVFIDEINSAPIEEINSAPIDEINSAPIDEINSAPIDEINSAPIDEINSAPIDEINSAPIDEINSAPIDEINSVPIDQISSDSISQEKSFVELESQGLLRNRRQKQVSQSNRKLLHTPVCGLTTEDTVKVKLQHVLHENNPTMRKRISLRMLSREEFNNDSQENGILRKKTSWPVKVGPSDKSEKENPSFTKNNSSSTKISVEVLDLADERQLSNRTVPFNFQRKLARQGSFQSISSISSDIDFDSYLHVKHSIFQSNIGNKRPTQASNQAVLPSVNFMRERSHATIVSNRQNHLSQTLEPIETLELNGSGYGNLFQPLIISSGKSLVKKSCETS